MLNNTQSEMIRCPHCRELTSEDNTRCLYCQKLIGLESSWLAGCAVIKFIAVVLFLMLVWIWVF